MPKRPLIILFCLFLASVVCLPLGANDSFWDGIARTSSFGRPFWADMHSTLIRIEMAYATNSPDYDWGRTGKRYRPFIYTNLGVDIPIWSGNFRNGRYGLSFTLPFMIDVFYDRLEWTTSPVLNTSFRFGFLDTVFIRRFNSPRTALPFNIYNWTLKLSVFKHESTHIGDELTVFRMHEGFEIIRIDVMYNYAELVFTLNDPDGQTRRNNGFKFGILFNYNFRRGWYWAHHTEANLDLVSPARFPFEFHVQYQYQSALFSRGFQTIISFEYRLRQRYRYPFKYWDGANNFFINNPPNLANCFNIVAGIRYSSQRQGYFSKIGIAARYYFGINPHGQFRSMPYFQKWGLSLIFE